MESPLGCGVLEHDESCLCDVIITKPLPPLQDCFRNAVEESFMGSKLCQLRGYSAPWTDAKMLDYFEDMTTFWDAFHYEQQVFTTDVDTLEQVEEIVFQQDEPAFTKWNKIRDAIQTNMDRFDASLIDIIQHLSLEPQETMNALTTNKCGDGWDYERVEKLDKLFMTEKNMAEIARQMNISIGFIKGLVKYWEKRRNRQGNLNNPARALLHELCRNTDLTCTEIIDKVKSETGHLYTKSAISKYRIRFKKSLQ